MSVVCDCYSLTRKKVMEAVRKHNLDTAEAVYEHFEASACGVCMEEIEAIVEQVTAENAA